MRCRLRSRRSRNDKLRWGKTSRAVVKAALAVYFFYYPRKRAMLPFGRSFLPFRFRKKKKPKEREFKGCALKNPLIVQSFCAQSRTLCLPSPQLQVALRRALSLFVVLCRASRGEICTKRKKRRVCTNITSSAPKPSPLDRRSQWNLNRRSQWNLNRRSQCTEGKAQVRIKISCQHNTGKAKFCRHNKGNVKLNSDHQNSISRRTPAVGAANARRRRNLQ